MFDLGYMTRIRRHVQRNTSRFASQGFFRGSVNGSLSRMTVPIGEHLEMGLRIGERRAEHNSFIVELDVEFVFTPTAASLSVENSGLRWVNNTSGPY